MNRTVEWACVPFVPNPDKWSANGRFRVDPMISRECHLRRAGRQVVVAVEIWSRPRVTACVVIRVVRRRRIGPCGASLSGAFPVASARHRARRPPRRSASSDRVLTGEFSGAFPVASARHSVCRLPRSFSVV